MLVLMICAMIYLLGSIDDFLREAFPLRRHAQVPLPLFTFTAAAEKTLGFFSGFFFRERESEVRDQGSVQLPGASRPQILLSSVFYPLSSEHTQASRGFGTMASRGASAMRSLPPGAPPPETDRASVHKNGKHGKRGKSD
jgi:hypothetical protein